MDAGQFQHFFHAFASRLHDQPEGLVQIPQLMTQGIESLRGMAKERGSREIMKVFPSLVSRLIGAAIAVGTVSPLASARAAPDSPLTAGAQRNKEASITRSQTSAAPAARLIVPCPVGSPADIFARHLAQMLSQSSGQQFDVENVASGALDAAKAREVQDDGRTIFLLPADPALPPACGD